MPEVKNYARFGNMGFELSACTTKSGRDETHPRSSSNGAMVPQSSGLGNRSHGGIVESTRGKLPCDVEDLRYLAIETVTRDSQYPRSYCDEQECHRARCDLPRYLDRAAPGDRPDVRCTVRRELSERRPP